MNAETITKIIELFIMYCIGHAIGVRTGRKVGKSEAEFKLENALALLQHRDEQ